ncbi:MAG: threonine--tRNA ligase [Candidatus Magasanikbacteria bacterium]|nr:threonine--tRNA ligase [Candidatus Magasanikbacteria bacterium]
MENEKLEKARHSCAHIVASAANELYPNLKFGVGPVIENGFYYDIDFPENIGEEDLQKIEDKAKELMKSGLTFERQEMSLEDGVNFFQKNGQIYKVELLNDLKKHGTTKISEEEKQEVGDSAKEISLYKSGEFTDLCRGPHIENSSELNPEGLKLTRLAGAYWRGKNENPQLQRIYGVYFETKQELEDHMEMLAEAEKRDHRKIAKAQELYFFDDKVGKGLVMWLPNGTIIRNEIEKLAVEKEDKAGYKRVVTPHLAKEELYITSGHLPYYKDDMYPAMEMDDGTYYLRSMNCPHHHLVFGHKPRSYKELPLRVAEYGTVYRNELSGTLAGLLRVRGLTMNDAHTYCSKTQIKYEFRAVINMTMDYFKMFDLGDYWFRLSKWDPEKTEKYINEPENWKFAENVLREVLQEMEVPFTEASDEAAFYGPKVDVQFKSIIGREETLSTVQLDFLAKERFGLKYIDETGNENNEVFVIHRAPLSTHERFIAFLIEHYAGKWPVWLAPVQVQFVPVSDKFLEGTKELAQKFVDAGVRIEIDSASETVGKKVRKAVENKVPYIIVVGERELSGDNFAVRMRDKDGETENINKEEFVERIVKEIKERK